MTTTEQLLSQYYRPTHDEQSRQNFVGAMKSYINGPMEKQLAHHYEQDLKPAYLERHGQLPQDREQGTTAFANDHLYQLWAATLFQSQNLMWETVDETCSRVLPMFEQRYDELETRARPGHLELAPELDIPEPIRSVEIHRQPGGYFRSPDKQKLLTGLRYFGTVELYRNAKGLSTNTEAGEPGMGYYVTEAVLRRFPDIKPASILDLGCGPGTETLAYRKRFPEADIWGVELSAPFLKFAHLWAEDSGNRINFRQADARHTRFEDQSFDLVVSNILFHETWHDIVLDIMKEARRLLRPGGVFLNVDVPYQPQRMDMTSQVTNHWQVVNNGEPFWSGFADMDMREELSRAGFGRDEIFADYDPLGQGYMHVFGARKSSP